MSGRERDDSSGGDGGGPTTREIAAIRGALNRTLGSCPQVQAALLYGSAAEGRPFRDLDIGLIVERGASPPEREIELAMAVEDELQKRSEHRVEVRVVNDAPPALRYSVTRGVPLVVRSSVALADFKERTWIEYFDFRPVALAYLREAG
jgi:predicted nucleotidyltransferase